MENGTNAELAVLGLVAEGEKHGYQIEQDIARRGMREWTEVGFSSIYYVLNRLEKAGWLASRRSAGMETGAGSGPARRVYHLTELGWEGYRAAVRERLAHPRPRSGDFDLGLANLPALAPDEARAALELYRGGLRAGLGQVRAKWAAELAAGGPFPAHVDALFSHSCAALQAELDWVENYLEATNGKPGLEEGL